MEKKWKITTITSIVLLVLLGVYTFKSNSDYRKLTTELETEKTEIKSELDKMIVQYDEKLKEATSLSEELSAARQDIVSYRDSLVREKRASYRIIKKYKSKVYALQAKNKELFAKVEALTAENEKLNVEIGVAKSVIETKEVENAELTSENEVLSEKVAIGSILSIDNLNAVPMRVLGTGELKETNRYKKTNSFRVSFVIDKNELTESGEKKVYFIIKDGSGAVVSQKGTVDIEGTKLEYSEEHTVDYQNDATSVAVMINVKKGTLKKSVYTISVILEKMAVGDVSVELKESFLGIF